MRYALNYTDYSAVCNIIETSDEKNTLKRAYIRSLTALHQHWTATLGGHKLAVLGFILNRTLLYGKRVAAIPMPAFLGGIVSEKHQEVIACGVGMAENTLRKVLRELEEDGFVHTFYPAKVQGKRDDATRYFEIDFKKILRLRSIGSRIMGILKEPRAKKTRVAAEENSDDGEVLRVAKPRKSGPSNLIDLSSIHEGTKVPNGITKVIHTAAPSARGGDAPAASVPTVRRILRSRPVATDPTPVPEQSAPQAGKPTVGDKVRGLLDMITAKSHERREAKAAKALGKKALDVRQDQLQAMIDKAMARYWPNLPRMVVTGKAFGAMRNHLKRSSPADFAEFVNWTVARWPELAQSHAKSALRREAKEGRDAKQYAPLPTAPNFMTFGTRLPFFLACYANYLSDVGHFGDRDTRKDDEIARVKRALEAKEQEVASARAIALREREKAKRMLEREEPEEAPAPRAPRAKPASDYDFNDVPDIPAWDDFQPTKNRR